MRSFDGAVVTVRSFDGVVVPVRASVCVIMKWIDLLLYPESPVSGPKLERTKYHYLVLL